MLVLRHLERLGRRFTAPVVTLGNFDGVHRGHQAILGRTVETAREIGGQAVAITFWPHPVQVLVPSPGIGLINGLGQRLELITECGIDAIVAQRFSKRFASITAEDFVRRLLCAGLGVRRIVVGHRVSFGHDRAGDAKLLRYLGAHLGVGVEIVDPVRVGELVASSSAVRRALQAGDLDRVRLLLGRPHTIAGRVIHGHHRGHMIGFPTANLQVRHVMLPPDGVYAVRLHWQAQWHPGIANIGFNPTFGDPERSIEVHVFDFDTDLYRQRVEVAFVRRLRGEARFEDAEALASQIRQDVAAARDALAQE